MGNLSRVLSTLIIPNPHSYLTPCTQVGVHLYSTCVHSGTAPLSLQADACVMSPCQLISRHRIGH